MNEYAGKNCPFCKTEFKPDDEIVVCSECEMPHHKDCWVENQGCTTFGCMGTIKTADGSADSVTATQMNYDEATTAQSGPAVFCTKCGAQNRAGSAFCSKCGNRLSGAPAQERKEPVYTQANPVNTNPYTYVNQQNNYGNTNYNNYQQYQSATIDAEVQQLIGTKAEYYIPKFMEMKTQNKQTSWNWPAFLIAPYWMIYRKMYGYGAALLGVMFVLTLIGTTLLSIVSLGIYIAAGLLGNYIYMNFLEGKANQAKSMPEPYKSQFIANNGDVNTTAAVLTAIGYAILIMIL